MKRVKTDEPTAKVIELFTKSCLLHVVLISCVSMQCLRSVILLCQ